MRYDRRPRNDAARAPAALLVSVLIGLSFPRFACSDTTEEPRLPQDVAEALARNASALDPISIEWERTRSTELSPETLLTRIRCRRSYGFLAPTTHAFEWQNGKSYLLSSCYILRGVFQPDSDLPFAYEEDLDLGVGYAEWAFDGEHLFTGNGADWDDRHRPLLIVERAEQADSDITPLGFPEYLGHAGFVFPHRGPDLESRPTSSILRLLEEGAALIQVQKSVVDGQEALLVDLVGKGRSAKEEDHKLSYRLLPEYRYAVGHHKEMTSDGTVLLSVDNRDFAEVPGTGTYLPKSSTVRHHAWITIPDEVFEQPLLEEVFTVEQMEAKAIDPQQFCLSEKYSNPGTHVADHTLPGGDEDGVDYLIPANPEDLDRVIEAAVAGESYTPAKRTRWFLIVAVGLIPLVLGFLFWRRSRQRHGKPS